MRALSIFAVWLVLIFGTLTASIAASDRARPFWHGAFSGLVVALALVILAGMGDA